ncbi:hypothetical protein [Paractinoplanes hotanensis]|uniref:CHAD domain-containing protein n=1 Tax=Paractinoplanes hotanensis TaxID=2906497 RepID=A0ABT0YDE8_9ACTN|nr:hypothetical protein [Actinoplanes hotanensis]MCM4083523.1 hypothetical protein [Actinoplanes hotanensis]
MLSDRDRTLLAPHVALLRAARKELATARRRFEVAEQGLTESAGGTDWRDRLLGGLFSADDGRTQRYRRARDEHRTARKALAEAESRYAGYAERVDGMLGPLLVRDDPEFRVLVETVRACDKALRACEEMRRGIASILKPDVGRAKDDRIAWHKAEFARRQRDELIQEVRTRGPGLRRTIERAALAVGEPPPSIDDVRGTGDRQLRESQQQLEAAIREIGRWRAGADRARTAALRVAHDSI